MKPYLLATSIILIMGAAACNDPVAVTPSALNSITGNVEGTDFTANDILATKDSNSIFSISGIINSDASFSLYVKDDGSMNHPIEPEGAFTDFTDYLEDLFNSEPPVADSLLLDSLISGLADLLSDTENILSPNFSFMFYTVGGIIYYSLDGTYTMGEIDEELGRINGSLNVRLSNFFGGRKDIEAILEDVQFYQE